MATLFTDDTEPLTITLAQIAAHHELADAASQTIKALNLIYESPGVGPDLRRAYARLCAALDACGVKHEGEPET